MDAQGELDAILNNLEHGEWELMLELASAKDVELDYNDELLEDHIDDEDELYENAEDDLEEDEIDPNEGESNLFVL